MVDNRIVMTNWEDGRQNESLFKNIPQARVGYEMTRHVAPSASEIIVL